MKRHGLAISAIRQAVDAKLLSSVKRPAIAGRSGRPQILFSYQQHTVGSLPRGLTLTTVFLVVVIALTLAAWSGSANQSTSPQQANTQEITPDKDVPVLDLKQAETNGSDQLKGRKRGQSLRQRIRIEELPAGVEPLPFSWHIWGNVPALPVEQSNAIVVGTVTDRCAVLTDDKLGIYSEFSIRISEIFKDDLKGLFIDQVITASRPGGAVRFPSGKIQQYTVSRLSYPQQDKVYVLFLKRDEVGDYSIFTGYEINGSVVQPLDGQRNLPKNESDLQFGIYRGVSVESFRNALQKAL